jgi:2-polyprenyl-3-methyl-5-hydroxy-6-metoxy-1,4-benzoquinol methylase
MKSEIDRRWSELYDQGRNYRLLGPQEMDKLLNFVPRTAPTTALDIGCGTGQLCRELHERGYSVVGVDASSSAIRKARSVEPSHRGRLSYVRCDFEHDDIADLPHQPYGLIICKLVYAFIKDQPAFLERVRRLLAPGGMFVVITPVPEEVPCEKKAIVARKHAMELLPLAFDQVAQYQAGGLIYFVGELEGFEQLAKRYAEDDSGPSQHSD